MTTDQEKHFCLNCNCELTENEAFETLDCGCPFCGQRKGFITLDGGRSPAQLPESYLDNYLMLITNKKAARQ